MHVVVVVVTSNAAWQHAGIGRMDVAAEHRQAHTRKGLHAEHSEDGDMAVAASDQDQVFDGHRMMALHDSSLLWGAPTQPTGSCNSGFTNLRASRASEVLIGTPFAVDTQTPQYRVLQAFHMER